MLLRELRRLKLGQLLSIAETAEVVCVEWEKANNVEENVFDRHRPHCRPATHENLLKISRRFDGALMITGRSSAKKVLHACAGS